MHPGRHPQGGRGTADGYDQQRPARAQQDQPRRQRDRQGGVVAGERPVPRWRTVGDRPAGQPGQRPAGPLLVEQHLQHFARPVGQHRAEPDQRHPRDRPGGPPGSGRPPAERQQQPQYQQPDLGGRPRQRGHRVRGVADGLHRPPVAVGRPPGRRPSRPRPATALRRQPRHHPGPRAEHGRGEDGPGPGPGRGPRRAGLPRIPVRVRHGPDGRSRRALSTRPESQAEPLTMVGVDSASHRLTP